LRRHAYPDLKGRGYTPLAQREGGWKPPQNHTSSRPCRERQPYPGYGGDAVWPLANPESCRPRATSDEPRAAIPGRRPPTAVLAVPLSLSLSASGGSPYLGFRPLRRRSLGFCVSIRTPHSALRNAFPRPPSCPPCRSYSSVFCTLHSALRTPHSALRTPHSTLHTRNSCSRLSLQPQVSPCFRFPVPGSPFPAFGSYPQRRAPKSACQKPSNSGQNRSKRRRFPSKRDQKGAHFVMPILTFWGVTPSGASARADLPLRKGHFGVVQGSKRACGKVIHKINKGEQGTGNGEWEKTGNRESKPGTRHRTRLAEPRQEGRPLPSAAPTLTSWGSLPRPSR